MLWPDAEQQSSSCCCCTAQRTQPGLGGEPDALLVDIISCIIIIHRTGQAAGSSRSSGRYDCMYLFKQVCTQLLGGSSHKAPFVMY
jgi:hypothetical protein